MKKLILSLVIAICLAISTVPKDARADISSGTAIAIGVSQIAISELIFVTVASTAIMYVTWKACSNIDAWLSDLHF